MATKKKKKKPTKQEKFYASTGPMKKKGKGKMKPKKSCCKSKRKGGY